MARTPFDIYKELVKYGKYEIRIGDDIYFSFDYGNAVKGYQVITRNGIVVQVRPYDINMIRFYQLEEKNKELQFGNF